MTSPDTHDRDQTLIDTDQTASEIDQTASDTDQTASDSDQTAADTDQAASDRDQAASDRDLVEGGDPGVHDLTRDLRDKSAQQRHEGAQGRVAAAVDRDAAADARDLEASARDHAAERHDRAVENRRVAASDRAAAAEARARASADREQAARDREQAARDRVQAEADRDSLLHQLAIAQVDQLTGARTRAAGLAELDHEIDRARRTSSKLVVTYVDVVGLKVVNDARGHGAGDELLRRAVRAIREQLRSYDLIVRLGGDEFLCVMSGATIDAARQRFAAMQDTLAAAPDPCEIRAGFAAFMPGDTAPELIQRADSELPLGRAT